MSLELSPSDIRYTQDSISHKFRNGSTLESTISDLVNGKITPGNIPKISVYKKDGNYYSVDNRRLYVFKELQSRSKPNLKIKAYITSMPSSSKLTTVNDGNSIRVRYGFNFDDDDDDDYVDDFIY